jgi:hypothetical protein
MTTQVRLDHSVPFVERVLKKRLVPMLHGSPAIGKSDIIRTIAEKFNLLVIDVRLSTYDPADMNGLPYFNTSGDRNIAEYVPFDVFPIEGDALPVIRDKEGNITHTYNGWLVFLDELPSAAPSVQAAAFKLILDKMVGQRKLHPKAALAAAGNMEDDGAIVNPLPTPLQSRMINFQVYTNLDCFMKYALTQNIDYRIAAFLEFKPDYVHHFKPDHDDLTFAAPRTWMFLDKLIRGEPVTDADLPLVAGCISSGVGAEFIAFCKIFDQVPKLADILADPLKARCPESDDNPSLVYAVAGSMAQHANKDNIDKLVPYIERMLMEYQVIAFRHIMARDPGLIQHEAMKDWIQRNSKELWH